MPRHIIQRDVLSEDQARLIETLAAELKVGRAAGQPIVLEKRLEASGNIMSDVIWDDFQSFDDAQRNRVILAAYEQAEGSDFANRITLAAGYTVAEAVNAGLLPYRVLPGLRRGDELADEDYATAMAEEGVWVDALGRPHLRYATEEAAREAIQRLEGRLPKSYWILAQEVSRQDW